MSFSAQVSKWTVTAARRNPKKVRDGVMLKLFGAVIQDSPVDTGRLRGNWQTNIGMPNLRNDSGEDKSGAAALSRVRSELNPARMEDAVYFTNNLPYAQTIENGSSKQSPAGMMRKNITRFENLIAQEARRVRS